MELLKKDKTWFLSTEGTEKFLVLSSLEERTIFIYSYLKTVVNKSFEKNNTLFKLAFFFADAIYNSNTKYATYPQILQSENPFLSYLMNADACYDNEKIYLILTSILHQKVDPAQKNEWIYNKQILNDEDLLEKLAEKGIEYLPKHSVDMIDPVVYEMDQSLVFLQLELVWLFLK